MDYYTIIQRNIETYNSEANNLKQRIAEAEKDLQRNKEERHGFLGRNLEEMHQNLASRDGEQHNKLSVKEKEYIRYVESGDFENAIKKMPSSARENHEKEIRRNYQAAKKKAPSFEDVVLCGYLEVAEKAVAGKREIKLTIPVLNKNKEKKRSLEEALYTHHIDLADFNFDSEEVDGEYVSLKANVPDEVLGSTLENITKLLEFNLPKELKNAGVDYKIIHFYKIKEWKKDEAQDKSKTYESRNEKTASFYSYQEAAELTRKKAGENGLDVPLRNAGDIVRYAAHEGLIKFVKKGNRIAYDRESLDNYLSQYTIIQNGYGENKFRRIRKDAIIPEFTEKVHISEAANSLGISETSLYRYAKKYPSYLHAAGGFVRGEGLAKFMKKFKKSGTERVRWRRK